MLGSNSKIKVHMLPIFIYKMLQNSIQSANLFTFGFYDCWTWFNCIFLAYKYLSILSNYDEASQDLRDIKWNTVNSALLFLTVWNVKLDFHTAVRIKLWHSCGQQRQTSVHKEKNVSDVWMKEKSFRYVNL